MAKWKCKRLPRHATTKCHCTRGDAVPEPNTETANELCTITKVPVDEHRLSSLRESNETDGSRVDESERLRLERKSVQLHDNVNRRNAQVELGRKINRVGYGVADLY